MFNLMINVAMMPVYATFNSFVHHLNRNKLLIHVELKFELIFK